MKCRKCGTDSPAEARFCSACGSPLTDPTGDTTTMIPVATEERGSVELTDQEREAAKALAEGNALLVVNRGTGDSSRFLIDSDITTVGRHPESDIFLDDITVSRNHAKFVRSGGKLYLEDLGSLNGTYVNRTLLDGRTVLREGDEIQIGKYRATISLSEPGLS
ncbi:FHA domain-containing protein [Tessaracoccus flavus]|uniref:Histidine kinase n=1 Tax=Tessaracoccus flavus TaxID=1610493 RepID=A0A1Q2CE16_9ACTN|nr:FHA domain-containing protein [Tessaracoccus flavus]AQP44372.1 histidine kinase [Tessaracoccus flavus]SDY67491.1 zinc-ribbon domain-containing protein [Tessaracoccus flavus]